MKFIALALALISVSTMAGECVHYSDGPKECNLEITARESSVIGQDTLNNACDMALERVPARPKPDICETAKWRENDACSLIGAWVPGHYAHPEFTEVERQFCRDRGSRPVVEKLKSVIDSAAKIAGEKP